MLTLQPHGGTRCLSGDARGKRTDEYAYLMRRTSLVGSNSLWTHRVGAVCGYRQRSVRREQESPHRGRRLVSLPRRLTLRLTAEPGGAVDNTLRAGTVTTRLTEPPLLPDTTDGVVE